MLSIPLHNGKIFTLDKAIIVEAKVGVGSLDLVLEDGMEKRWLLQMKPQLVVNLSGVEVKVNTQIQLHVEEIEPKGT